jgi:neutral ceramidase
MEDRLRRCYDAAGIRGFRTDFASRRSFMNVQATRRAFLQQSAGIAAVATATASLGTHVLAGEDAAQSVDESASWRAGVARSVITPEKAVWLAGYGTKRPPDGVLHDLWMKALALEDLDGRRVVLITSDFQGVPKSMSDRVFAKLQERFGLAREHVIFTFSHNHCGPRLADDLVDYYPVEEEQVALVAEYTARMEEKAVALVADALANLAPAALQMGEGRCTFAVNRRNNVEAEVPALLAAGKPLVGPVDHAVPVLTITRPDGHLEAILFGYACHPTTLSFLTWCGDYPGFAQLELEKAHVGATAMFVNTCGGDQNPLPRRSVELCQKYGHMLAVGVENVLQRSLAPIGEGIRTAFEYVELDYLEVVGREYLHEAMQGSEAIRGRWAARMLDKLDAGEQFPTSCPYPVHAWRLGQEMLVIGQGAETVVDYALRFKAEFGPGTWVLGYADDMVAYIPSRRVWEEGGYEGGSNLFEYGRPALRWAGDIENRIATTVARLVKQVHG